jgi:hypothetical protein
LRRHRQRVQQATHRLRRVHHLLGRVEPAQVDVELAVREMVGDLVRPMDREGRLAHAGGSADHHHGHATARVDVGLHELCQHPPFDLAADEVRRRRGQGPRHDQALAAASGRRVGLTATGRGAEWAPRTSLATDSRARVAALLDPVPDRGQHALLRRARPQELDQHVEPVGRGEGLAAEVEPDERARPTRLGRQLAIGQLRIAPVSRVPTSQLAQQAGEVGHGTHGGGVRTGDARVLVRRSRHNPLRARRH